MKKTFLIFFIFLLSTPILVSAIGNPTPGPLVQCDICTIDDFIGKGGNPGIITRITNFFVYDIATPAAILFLTIGGIILLISAGNPELKNLGKKILVTTVIGMALVFCAGTIINFILTTLGAKPLP